MWIKICGIRTLDDARCAVRWGADAIGLNFYSGTPRQVDLASAGEIARAVDTVTRVGVFVNHPVDEIAAVLEQVPLDVLQIHGDESLADVAAIAAAFPGKPLIRAYRVGGEGLEPVLRELDEAARRGIDVWRVLIDARVPGAFGGTGRTAPWDVLRSLDEAHRQRLLLAGGLTPENVAEGIRTVRPWGVDVAGGVEIAPGVKSESRVAAFIEAARGVA